MTVADVRRVLVIVGHPVPGPPAGRGALLGLFAYHAVGGAVIALAALLPYRRHTSAGAQPVGQRALRPVPVARQECSRGDLAAVLGTFPRPRRRGHGVEARRDRASRRTSACPGRRPRAGCRNGHAGLGLIKAARRKLGRTSTRRSPGPAPGRRGATGRRPPADGCLSPRPGPPRSSPAAPPGSRSQTRSGGRAGGLRVRVDVQGRVCYEPLSGSRRCGLKRALQRTGSRPRPPALAHSARGTGGLVRTFAGMIQHRRSAVREVQVISRNLAYQAIVD